MLISLLITKDGDALDERDGTNVVASNQTRAYTKRARNLRHTPRFPGTQTTTHDQTIRDEHVFATSFYATIFQMPKTNKMKRMRLVVMRNVETNDENKSHITSLLLVASLW